MKKAVANTTLTIKLPPGTQEELAKETIRRGYEVMVIDLADIFGAGSVVQNGGVEIVETPAPGQSTFADFQKAVADKALPPADKDYGEIVCRLTNLASDMICNFRDFSQERGEISVERQECYAMEIGCMLILTAEIAAIFGVDFVDVSQSAVRSLKTGTWK